MISAWYECDEKYLPAHYQPALLLDLLLARDISSHKVLRGTGLFYDDILAGKQKVSANQLKTLIATGCKLSPEPDLSFRWGDNLWPGHYGSGSQLLSNAPDLRHALKALVNYRRFLSPLLAPRIVEDERYCYVQWLDSVGLQEQHRFMVETTMMALTSMSRWLAGRALPWRYGFSYGQPAWYEEYAVHFGASGLQFGLGADVMIIEKKWLDMRWPRGSETAFRAEWQQAELMHRDQPRDGFCEAVYHWLLANLESGSSLSAAAQAFAMSPATFKRKLKKHNSQFQQLQDMARLHVCLYLLHIKGMNNEQVAARLHFNDTTNFRRAFKRWTGLTPSDSRQQFLLMPDSAVF
ncbi:MAG: AraC family transcriptional regulator [Oceanospirillaceae bacterium]|nr:AraC family transcriptional regulator [Oceanospirillaceae bacterium]MBT14158.1 AraC family transcriptional regulator [Oceanospirillaceae bacterium]|tara:strand:+ start:9303 stop:10352 length:1050 start_codon:yes stop_codon:yes gene_type:complete